MSESNWAWLKQIVLHWEEIVKQLKAIMRSINCFADLIQIYLNAALKDREWTKCVSKQVLLLHSAAYYLYSANADCEMQLNRGYIINQFFTEHLSSEHKNTVIRQFWEFWMKQKKFADHNYIWQQADSSETFWSIQISLLCFYDSINRYTATGSFSTHLISSLITHYNCQFCLLWAIILYDELHSLEDS